MGDFNAFDYIRINFFVSIELKSVFNEEFYESVVLISSFHYEFDHILPLVPLSLLPCSLLAS